MTTYINIFGGPGIGKSTTAASLFADMKKQEIKVELVTEVAKDFVWENRMETLAIQPYVTMKQYRNLIRLKGKIDFVITDAPILFGILYANKFALDLPESYHQFVKDCHSKIISPSINILLERTYDYDIAGRYQSVDEAIVLDGEIEAILDENLVDYIKISPEKVSYEMIIG
jgi:hypothetical protein